MLKKSDLAKQFELVVKQEIINHNSQIEQSNALMRDLQAEIIKLRREVDCLIEINGQSENKIKSFEREIKKFEDSQIAYEEKINQNYERLRERVRAELEIAILNSVNANHGSDRNKESIEAICNQLAVFRDEILGFHEIYRNELKNIERKSLVEIKKAKEEIYSKPKDTDILKKELEEKIASYAVDVTCLLKELRIISHNVVVAEKKIENIYTLIGRIKKAEALS